MDTYRARTGLDAALLRLYQEVEASIDGREPLRPVLRPGGMAPALSALMRVARVGMALPYELRERVQRIITDTRAYLHVHEAMRRANAVEAFYAVGEKRTRLLADLKDALHSDEEAPNTAGT